jgi:aspartyl-tRNA(Asn)/glutamyl-tRNA(Gln) amidotransferase subunit C
MRFCLKQRNRRFTLLQLQKATMPVSEEEVRRAAQLARLQFAEEEIEAMTDQLGEILDYMSTLDDVDTAGVPPMKPASDAGENLLRDDEAHGRISREEKILARLGRRRESSPR